MLTNLTKDQLALAELMSQISEAGFSAGWMMGLEYDLWTALKGGSRKYGHYIITQDDINQLQSLANQCGCWIVFDDEHEETAVELKTCQEMYSGRSIK